MTDIKSGGVHETFNNYIHTFAFFIIRFHLKCAEGVFVYLFIDYDMDIRKLFGKSRTKRSTTSNQSSEEPPQKILKKYDADESGPKDDDGSLNSVTSGVDGETDVDSAEAHSSTVHSPLVVPTVEEIIAKYSEWKHDTKADVSKAKAFAHTAS